MLYPMLQPAASSPWMHTWSCARSCRGQADGRMRTGGKILLPFLPCCHSGSYVTLLCIFFLPASCCHSAVLFPPFSCPAANPSFSINHLQPKEVPLSLLFILSHAPGVILSSFPTSRLFTLDTFYHCFSHLWSFFFLLAISYLAAGKDIFWANFSLSRVKTHNSQ